MFRPHQCFARARRAAVKRPVFLVAPRASRVCVKRGRKGFLAGTKAAWRRCATGSNHISAFGVWQGRIRRAMTRVNRVGETRWHRLPSTGRQGVSQKGTS